MLNLKSTKPQQQMRILSLLPQYGALQVISYDQKLALKRIIFAILGQVENNKTVFLKPYVQFCFFPTQMNHKYDNNWHSHRFPNISCTSNPKETICLFVSQKLFAVVFSSGKTSFTNKHILSYNLLGKQKFVLSFVGCSIIDILGVTLTTRIQRHARRIQYLKIEIVVTKGLDICLHVPTIVHHLYRYLIT